jgi:hypothetical protein
MEPRLRDGIELVRDYGELPPVRCYAGQLNQVFMNLLMNACDALEGKGRILIRTRTRSHSRDGEADGVRLEFHDDGPGITPDVQARIFEPFFTTKPVGRGRASGSRSPTASSSATAAGCWWARRRARATTFVIELPLVAKAADRAGGGGGLDSPAGSRPAMNPARLRFRRVTLARLRLGRAWRCSRSCARRSPLPGRHRSRSIPATSPGRVTITWAEPGAREAGGVAAGDELLAIDGMPYLRWGREGRWRSLAPGRANLYGIRGPRRRAASRSRSRPVPSRPGLAPLIPIYVGAAGGRDHLPRASASWSGCCGGRDRVLGLRAVLLRRWRRSCSWRSTPSGRPPATSATPR